ncbi:MAG TPA: type II secretion system minor pseudopilin GspK [Myxococcales bacterium]|nr:type II secretion system minor pseudopilin GspK [Myxococcales bacterium]
MSARTSRKGGRERGVAMLIAIISIAILTVVATEFAYSSRVDLQLAANQRDGLQAYYLARSGLGLSRLMLKFQRQLDKTPIPNLGGLLGALGGGAGGLGGGGPLGGAGGQSPTMSLQIWRLAKVDCHMLRGMVRSEPGPSETGSLRASSRRKLDFDDEFPDVAREQQKVSFGGFEGCFNATITDEEQKLNLVRLDSGALAARPVATRLFELFSDKRFEFLFDHEDANRVKVTPQELIISLKDWIDDDDTQSTLNVTPGWNTNPFQPGFADENYNYDKYDPRYRTKNALFDSLDELFLVHGMNDQVMAAFRDRFTVYPDKNKNLNINTDDPVMLYMAILMVADPNKPDPRLKDPLFIDQLIKQVRAARMFNFVGSSVADFVNVVAAAGVQVDPAVRGGSATSNQLVSDKSETYRVQVVGEAGSVQRTITAVIRLDDQLGKLVYWRED